MGGEGDVEAEDQGAVAGQAVGEGFGSGHEDDGFAGTGDAVEDAVAVAQSAGEAFLFHIKAEHHGRSVGLGVFWGVFWGVGEGQAELRQGHFFDGHFGVNDASDGAELFGGQGGKGEGGFEHGLQPLLHLLGGAAGPLEDLVAVGDGGFFEQGVEAVLAGLGFADVGEDRADADGEA